MKGGNKNDLFGYEKGGERLLKWKKYPWNVLVRNWSKEDTDFIADDQQFETILSPDGKGSIVIEIPGSGGSTAWAPSPYTE